MEAVYLDYAATTPVRDEVRAAMAPYESECFGNPSSLHRWGREAAAALEDSRASVAAALGARHAEIRFVRGGTESDNLAIVGACRALCARGAPPRLLVSAVEHTAVMAAAEHASEAGLAVYDRIPVFPDGSMDFGFLRDALGNGPAVVSTMWVNNETGMVLPVAELAAIGKEGGAIVHTDASQAVGKVPVDLSEVPVDLLTATGHKIYGPKGMGILFVRSGTSVSPLLYGGGQERALRPGTEDVGGAVGFATALRLAVASQADDAARIARLRERLEAGVTASLEGTRINAGGAPRAPHVASFGFTGIASGPSLVMALDLEGLAVSGGSACSSGSSKGSHVIAALYGADDPYVNVRFSFGMRTTEADIDRAVTITTAVVNRVRGA
jgi:cysteine desulfurase